MAKTFLPPINFQESDNASLVAYLTQLQQQYKSLYDHHTALMQINFLSQKCHELTVFYRQVHQVIAHLMPAENFYIVMYDQTFETLEFVYHVDEQDVSPEGVFPFERFKGTLTRKVIESGKAILATPELINDWIDKNELENVGSVGLDWLGVPLLHEGYVIGVMVVQSYSENIRYQQQDLELLNYAAQHIVTAMLRLQDHERLQTAVNARTSELMEQIREREKAELLQESLFKISELTNDFSLDIEQFYAKVHNIIGQLINASNFFIAKYNKESETIEFVYYVDQSSLNLAKDFQPRKFSNLYSELVIQRKETVLLSVQDMKELFEKGNVGRLNENLFSWLGVPLVNSTDVIGVMVIQSYRKSTIYTQSDAELLNFVAHHVSTAIKRREAADYERQSHEMLEQQVKIRTVALEEEIKQRKQAEELLTHSASHDSLTGLPNRTLFVDLLNHAIASLTRHPDKKFAVLFLDLDRFKMVNDSLGHHAGDLLLQVIAKELQLIVRNKDTVARLGGDEFVILIEDLVSNEEAYEIAQRITHILSQPFTIEEHPVFIGTSVGLLFSDSRYDSAETMLRDADTAMYHAKDQGKGRVEEFDASMQKKLQEDLALEIDIRDAIKSDEFIPYFQPIMHLKHGRVAGFEALARWHSNKRGMVMPNDFIPVAEETKLVLAIDLQIMEKACQKLKELQHKFACEHWYVSCNLFCNHFFSPTLLDDIKGILERVGLDPKHLRVELTERALLEQNDIVLSNMQALKHYGVKILLDDFGTGYSSLGYLHRFPLDVLKIDRSFVTNVDTKPRHKAIIKTIIDLAANLQMAAVGEGIENQAEADLLKDLDCVYGQGYFFAKPMPIDELEVFIDKNLASHQSS